MREQIEFKVKKNLRHVIGFIIAAVAVFLLIVVVEITDLFCIAPIFLGIGILVVAFIALLISLIYFPMTINLTYMVKIKYFLGKQRDIPFFDIEYYDLNAFWLGEIIDIKLKNGKTISFFFDKKDFDYIQQHFENHNVRYGKG